MSVPSGSVSARSAPRTSSRVTVIVLLLPDSAAYLVIRRATGKGSFAGRPGNRRRCPKIGLYHCCSFCIAALHPQSIVHLQQSPIFVPVSRWFERTGGSEIRDPFLLPGFSVISGGAFLLPGVTASFFPEPDQAVSARCSDTARSSSIATGLRSTVVTDGAMSNSSPLAKSEDPVIMMTLQSGFA